MNEPLRIRYWFDLPDGSQKSLEFSFDPTTFKLLNPPPADPPFWAELKFNRCANCPLNEQDHPHCPAALQMAAPCSVMVRPPNHSSLEGEMSVSPHSR